MTTEWIFLLGGLLAGGILAALILKRTPPTPPKAAALAEPSGGFAQARLDTVQRMNRLLVDASNEQELMTGMLDLVLSSSGAAGASYTPLDELGQPLAVLQRGATAILPLHPWSERLASAGVQQVCRSCQVLHNPGSDACPLAGNPFGQHGLITCLPLERGSRRLGIVNIYHRQGQDAIDSGFLADLLAQTSLAVDNLRIHAREVAILQDLQMSRHSGDETSVILRGLLESLAATLECDAAVLLPSGDGSRLAPLAAGRLTGMELQAILAGPGNPESPIVEMNATAVITRARAAGCQAAAWKPVQVPSGTSFGSLVILRTVPRGFSPQELRLLAAGASQAGLILDNERRLLEIEMRAVIDERTRLAREIHDGLAQNLAFLKLQTAQMNGLLARGDLKDLAEMIGANHQVITDTYAEIRQAINSLRTSPETGLHAWLPEMVRDFRQTTGMEVVSRLLADPERVPTEVQPHLIRIIQESLNNIRKHAHATRVDISLRPFKGDLILEIHDDGRGFLPEDVPSPTQYGLRGMRERAEMIGADFQIISQPGEGTTVLLHIPCRFHEEVAG